MKLRNKKTGETVSLSLYGITVTSRTKTLPIYRSIAELTEEWEDYEEPKEYWYIDCDGKVYEPTRLQQSDLDRMEEIGNYFESKEEAEKAVEKLKAWKRLKDKGFRFKGYEGIWGETDGGACGGEGKIDFAISGNFRPKDLDLLFGSEDS